MKNLMPDVLSPLRSELGVRGLRVVLTLVPLVLTLVAGLHAERSLRSVHGDESWVATKVRSGGYEPHALSTPPLYYLSARAAVRLFGPSDFVLRLPAQLFALMTALVPLALWPLVRDAIPLRAAAVWSALLLFSSPLSFYATRMKQYTAEAFAATLLVTAGLAAVLRPNSGPRLLFFAASGALAAATTHAAPFVLFGTGVLTVGELGNAALRGDGSRRRSMGILLGVHLLFAAVFALAWLLYLRPGPRVAQEFGDLTEYFRRAGERFYFDGTLSFVVDRTRHWLGQYLNLTRFALALMTLTSIAWLSASRYVRIETRLGIAGAILAPTALVLAASARELFPYGEVRLMSFCYPGVALLFALGLDFLMQPSTPLGRTARVLTLVLLCVYAWNGFVGESYNRSYMRSFDQSAFWRLMAGGATAEDRIEAGASAGAALLHHHPALADRVRLWEERPARPGPLPVPAWPDAPGAVWLIEGEQRPLYTNIPRGWKKTLELSEHGTVIRRFERDGEWREDNARENARGEL